MSLREQGEEERDSIWRSPYTWAVLVCLVGIPLMRPLLRFEPPPPQPMFVLPTFSLVDSEGRRFGTEELAGSVYITDFIATDCKTACLQKIDAMAKLQRRFADRRIEHVHLVSITVDPETDTVERLAEYAREHDLDLEHWSLLTGSVAQVRNLLRGFGLALEPGESREGGSHPLQAVAHLRQLVMVDRFGQVRGFYRDDELGLDEVFHRAQHVLDDRRPPLPSDRPGS